MKGECELKVIKLAVVLAFGLLAPTNLALAKEPGAVSASDTSPAPKISKRIAKILAKGDGRSKATAFKVSSVGDEYEILRNLGVQPVSQALVVEGKAYDLMTTRNPVTGETQEFWFDISRFFGRY